MAGKFYGWLSTYLKDRGLQFSKSGFKGGSKLGNHRISEESGFWEDLPYSTGKPPRWLYQIELSNGVAEAHTPNHLDEVGIGASNTAQGDKAGLAVRILPLVRTGPNAFKRLDDFEINVLFVFHGALSPRSSSDGFSFSPSTGRLKRLNNPEEYIFASLLGLRSRADSVQVEIDGQPRVITYGEVFDAVAADIKINLKDQEQPVPIPKYDISLDEEIERLKADLVTAWDAAGPSPKATRSAAALPADDDESDAESLDYTHVDIPQNNDLLGIDPAVYRQINSILKSGKQHLMLYGPPGTGKTSLARWIATCLPGGQWTLITGSSDWSSQDIIGGYQPLGAGEVDFVPGVLLREFNNPLIIDELNRCDIDKVLGPLFTVLSGQQTTLPYRTDIADKDSLPYTILPKPKARAAPHEFAPGEGWRLIATINSIDKASLYQMSYALSRRFGWVYVDAPKDLSGFVREFFSRAYPDEPAPQANAACPLAEVWKAINAVRVIGPAPIIDAIFAMRAINSNVEFFGPATPAARSGGLDAFDMVLLPMLDGIMHQEAIAIADAAVVAFNFDEAEQIRIRTRLESIAI